jgi:putative protease
MSYKRPNNRGIRLGRIEKIKEREGLAQVKLDEKLRVGDGVEIWVTKGGRQGFFVETIYLQGNKVEERIRATLWSLIFKGNLKWGTGFLRPMMFI